jgi:hypothetical protein
MGRETKTTLPSVPVARFAQPRPLYATVYSGRDRPSKTVDLLEITDDFSKLPHEVLMPLRGRSRTTGLA